MFSNHRQQCWWFLNFMTDQQINVNALPFKPGDWVKVVKKPKEAKAIRKGDVLEVEQVSPSKQMIRIGSPDFGWDYLNWDEIALTLPPPDVSLRDDNVQDNPSLRDDKQPDICEPVKMSVHDDNEASLCTDKPDHPLWQDSLDRRIMEDIRCLFNRLSPSLRDDIIEELLSLRNDSIDDSKTLSFFKYPQIVWLSPGGRQAKYPWFQWRGERAYIGGGNEESAIANGRVAKIREWLDAGVRPVEIIRRIRGKQFD